MAAGGGWFPGHPASWVLWWILRAGTAGSPHSWGTNKRRVQAAKPAPLTAHPESLPIRGSGRRPNDRPASAQHSNQTGSGVHPVSDSGIIGQAYGRRIHAREVVAIDEAGDGLCWVRLTRFGVEWLLIRSDARDVSRAVRKLRQIPAGKQSDRFPEFGP